MNEQNTPDLVALARDVLDDELGWEVKPGDAMHSEDAEALCRLANAAPTLARAVIDLTAKVERMEALADRLEHEAAYEATQGDDWDAVCIRSEARRIRAALEGGTND